MTASRTLAPQQLAGSATVTGVLAMADLRAGDLVAERFRIVRLIGMGGMGVVYQAHDTELDVDVALKLLRPELASRPDAFERFRQELLLARQVSSPHVVRIHDLVRHGEVWLISMDYVPGQSLERLLDTQGHLPPEDAIRIVRQLALGLGAAHQRGVVHRDLKPANVLISEEGEARITDFGVARSAGATGITVSGVIIGTPEYLSPEQARAEPVDGRSDLYALGLIFFEMLTGTLPFRGGTPAEMLAQRIVRDPPPPDTVRSDLPSFAVRLCTRLLELKPSRRFQTTQDVVHAIDFRRVPFDARRYYRVAGAALVIAAAIGFAFSMRYFGDVSRPGAARAIAAPVDLALMPFVVSTTDATDKDLATGIRQILSNSLVATSSIRVADAQQVDRALTELGYDADAARRQRDRVTKTLGATRLLEFDLDRSKDDRYTIRASLWTPNGAQPSWTDATLPVLAPELPNALAALQEKLRRFLHLPEQTAAQWPVIEDMRTVGALRSAQQSNAPMLANAVASARQHHDPGLWWSALQNVDRTSQTADQSTLARQAKDDLASLQDPHSARVKAYADLLMGQPESAVKALEQLVAASPNDNAVQLLLARAQAELGKFEDAHKILEDLVANDPRDVNAWFALGKYSIMAGDSKRAVDDYLQRANVLARRLNDRRALADVVNAMGIGYQNLGQLDDSAEQFESAIKLREALEDKRGEAVSLRNLSFVRAVQGNFKDAQAALDKAKTILEPLGDTAATAGLINDIGALDEERGDYRRALESYRSALSMHQSLGDPRLIARSLVNVGFAYYQVGEFDNAQVYWMQAAAAYEKFDDVSGSVSARMSLALAQIAKGDFKPARELLENGLNQAEKLQMAEARAIGAANLAELDRLEGRLVSALERSEAALDQFKQREDPRGIVEMKLLRSAIFRDLGDWDSAQSALADLSADNVENREQAAILLWRLGEIALGRGDVVLAMNHANEAVTTAQAAHSYGTELSARLLRARVLLAQKKDSAAAAELTTTRAGLAKFASIPLRLQLAETALQVNGPTALPDYRAARAELARLPSYGRAFEIHALAAGALRKQADAGEAEAVRAAKAAYDDLAKNTPAAQQPSLTKLANAYGLTTVVADE